MTSHETRVLEVPEAAGAGRKQDVRNWESPISIQITADPGGDPVYAGDYDYDYEYGAGSFAGRLRVEVSLDGIQWALPQNLELQEIIAVPHPLIEPIAEKVNWLRVQLLEITAGSPPKVQCSGRRQVG